MASADVDINGFVCPRCRLLVSATSEQLGTVLVCPCCDAKVRVPKEDDAIPQLGASMKTNAVHVASGKSVSMADTAWQEDLPVELLAEQSKGLPWHMLLPAALVGLLLIGTLLNVLLSTESHKPVVFESAVVEVSRTVDEVESQVVESRKPEHSEILAYFEKLSDCDSIESLRGAVRPAPGLERKLQRFYSSTEIQFVEPQEVVSVVKISGYSDRFFCSVRGVDGKVRKSVLFDIAGDYLLDWESFVAYCDLEWEKIMEVQPREAIAVRCIRAVSEYYNHGFDSDDYQCFELTRIGSDTRFYAYAKRDGALLSQLLPLGVSTQSIEMTLSVRYPEEIKDARLLIIDSVLSGSWIQEYKD